MRLDEAIRVIAKVLQQHVEGCDEFRAGTLVLEAAKSAWDNNRPAHIANGKDRGMSNDTKSEVERYAELAVNEARQLNRIAEGLEPNGQWVEDNGLDEVGFDVADVLNNNALEVYANARLDTGGAKDIRSVVVVLGTGGPHYEFEIDWKGNVEGRAYWGGESATVRAYDMESLGEYLVELFGGWDS